MTENLIQKIKWQRIGLNAVSVFLIVFASAWGNDLTLALKAGLIAACLAFGRELQEVLQDTNGKKTTEKLSNFLLF